jgi:hypothetical protein
VLTTILLFQSTNPNQGIFLLSLFRERKKTMTLARNITVHSWSKKGWKKSQQVDPTYDSPRRRMPYCKEEFDFHQPGNLEFVQAAQEEIQTGRYMEIIDSLTQADRQIYEASDVWYIKNGKLGRIVDPISQVYEFGEWGADSSDCDPGQKGKSAIRTFLEDAGIIKPTANLNYMVDEVAGDPSELVDIAFLDKFVFDQEVDEDDDNPTNKTMGDCVPLLSKEIEAQVVILRDKCYERIVSLSNEDAQKEIEEFEKKVEKLIHPYLGMNYCSIGYSAPQMRYVKIFSDTESPQTSAAKDRGQFFYDLLSEANDIRSKDALYGPVGIEGQRDLTKGFYGRIHGMYEHDKAIRNQWSMNDKFDNQGNLVQESAFKRDRKAFICSCRTNGVDEETLRSLLWSWFDRKQVEVIPQFGEDGAITRSGGNYKDSIWKQKRSAAFEELFLTRGQWNCLYKVLDIAKQRIVLEAKPGKEQEEAIAKLKEYFKAVRTLADLERYKRWAKFRKPVMLTVKEGKKDKIVKTLDFTKSVIDSISFSKEHKWWMTVVKKEQEIKRINKLSSLMAKEIKHIVPTNKEEVSTYCECDRTIIQKPFFAAIKHGKGKYFVKCECGKITWLDVVKVSDFQTLVSYEK